MKKHYLEKKKLNRIKEDNSYTEERSNISVRTASKVAVNAASGSVDNREVKQIQFGNIEKLLVFPPTQSVPRYRMNLIKLGVCPFHTQYLIHLVYSNTNSYRVSWGHLRYNFLERLKSN